ncbi:hypothetical protein CK203_059993 [Vitis vinifera]|uniref:Uncharacterized protein n=1 Tax=Vitis vinifera TaxID=29760 RepID=A0A438GFA8_VITVI|nr:hypothetical protein CK203_059993 [Vitis vinifera]
MAKTPLESMDIVSSHSWSHSNQKRRKSTSLSHKKPKQIRVRKNAKKLKGRNRSEIGQNKNRVKKSKNRGLRDFAASAKLALRCETISQPKRSRCEINMSLRKRPSFAKSFRNSFDSSAKIFAAAKPSLAHECHFAEQEPPFRSCEGCEATKRENTRFAVKAPFRRVFRSCETKFGTRVPFRSTVTSISKLRSVSKGGNAIAAVCSSPSRARRRANLRHLLRSSLRPNFDSPIWREPEEPNLPLLPAANESARGPVQAPPLNLRGQKLFPLRRSPPKILRRGVISLEPSPAPSPVPSPAPPAQPQELQPPLSEPQIPSGVAPEVIIRRPMLSAANRREFGLQSSAIPL